MENTYSIRIEDVQSSIIKNIIENNSVEIYLTEYSIGILDNQIMKNKIAILTGDY
jgi:hypothetical protein